MVLALVIVSFVALVELVLLIVAIRPTKLAKYLPPLFEKGHRGYEVANEPQRTALLEVLKLGGLTPIRRFKIGPTDQTLMSDGYTVVNLHDHRNPDTTGRYSGTFISLVNRYPQRAATNASRILQRIDPSVDDCLLPIPGKAPLAPVYSPKLGLTVTFRQHAMKLGPPPGRIPV